MCLNGGTPGPASLGAAARSAELGTEQRCRNTASDDQTYPRAKSHSTLYFFKTSDTVCMLICV